MYMYLQLDQVPRAPDLAILMSIMTTTTEFLPLAHVCGEINKILYFLEFFLRVLLISEHATCRYNLRPGTIQGWVQLVSQHFASV